MGTEKRSSAYGREKRIVQPEFKRVSGEFGNPHAFSDRSPRPKVLLLPLTYAYHRLLYLVEIKQTEHLFEATKSDSIGGADMLLIMLSCVRKRTRTPTFDHSSYRYPGYFVLPIPIIKQNWTGRGPRTNSRYSKCLCARGWMPGFRP